MDYFIRGSVKMVRFECQYMQTCFKSLSKEGEKFITGKHNKINLLLYVLSIDSHHFQSLLAFLLLFSIYKEFKEKHL